VWRVHRWELAWFSLWLGDTEDQNDVSEQSFNEWPLDTLVDSLIFRWLRETLQPMLVNESAEYSDPHEDKTSHEALLHEPKSLKCTLSHPPPSPQNAVLCCSLPGQPRHLKWWHTKFLADNLDIFYMLVEMGVQKCSSNSTIC
jgi:hypothetical protein